ncbi:HAD family hydrolase [Gelidibacter sp.]|uniref:HAD family hydrolase n=1 Tax=Gelidibacter sp. TaxID=2018083 RepID=UPI002C53478D|nr:HAD family hydrolase [Gelidibacter sp.]HUH27692.1 HAD family hydrolase [Gelidibacter sp.]
MKYQSLIALSCILFICLGCKNESAQMNPVLEVESVQTDPLPSWNEGNSKEAILAFVTKTTTEDGPDFIPEADRIATFDNDGTLWSEQPMYFQLAFAIDQVNVMSTEHPEWKTQQPFKALLEGDMKTALAGGAEGLLPILAATHTGMTTDAFEKTVKDWMATATHPVTKKHYNEMIYQPMLELLHYLRAHGYKTFIVSGGGIDFMRPWIEQAYGIPPHQVVGSTGKMKYEMVDGKPVLMKLAELNFNNDEDGKPIGIHQFIGKRPVFAAGNSDGDYQMIEWTTSASGYPRFGMFVHHTDAEREYAYDRDSHIGKLNKDWMMPPKTIG